jgi:hypothetical protein
MTASELAHALNLDAATVVRFFSSWDIQVSSRNVNPHSGER